jgi:hypothetical protein
MRVVILRSNGPRDLSYSSRAPEPFRSGRACGISETEHLNQRCRAQARRYEFQFNALSADANSNSKILAADANQAHQIRGPGGTQRGSGDYAHDVAVFHQVLFGEARFRNFR